MRGREAMERGSLLPLANSAGQTLSLEGLQVNGDLGEVSPRAGRCLPCSSATVKGELPGAPRRGRAPFTCFYFPVKDAPAKPFVKSSESPPRKK